MLWFFDAIYQWLSDGHDPYRDGDATTYGDGDARRGLLRNKNLVVPEESTMHQLIISFS